MLFSASLSLILKIQVRPGLEDNKNPNLEVKIPSGISGTVCLLLEIPELQLPALEAVPPINGTACHAYIKLTVHSHKNISFPFPVS